MAKSSDSQLELANIPQILSLLEQERIIDEAQKKAILAAMNEAKALGKSAFAGETGIALGFYDQETLEQTLVKQTLLKAEAAISDIQTIQEEGTIESPVWLKANWGNNGVNPASDAPTLADGVSSAANIAQNMVMLANSKPDIITPALVEAISSAANLARGIHDSSSARVPLESKSEEWLVKAQNGLRYAVETSGHTPKDRKGETIDIEEFITERSNEINAAITQQLANPKQHDSDISL